MRKVLADLLISLITFGSLASIVSGCWQIYRPAAWIACGLVGILIANGMNRGARKP